MKWMPDRKFLAGGLGGIFGWLIIMLIGKVMPEWEIDHTMAMEGGAMVAAVLIYFVPPAAGDIAKRVDKKIIALAKTMGNTTSAFVPILMAVGLTLSLGACASVPLVLGTIGLDVVTNDAAYTNDTLDRVCDALGGGERDPTSGDCTVP